MRGIQVMELNDDNTVATRLLYYARQGETARHECLVRVSKPFLLTAETAGYPFKQGDCRCYVEFDGLPERGFACEGVDGVQALVLALNFDPVLKHHQKKYAFYFADGEPYFED